MRRLGVLATVVLATALFTALVSPAQSASSCVLEPNANLAGCDFSGRSLNGSNVDFSIMTDVKLTSTTGQPAAFNPYDLSGADMTGSPEIFLRPSVMANYGLLPNSRFDRTVFPDLPDFVYILMQKADPPLLDADGRPWAPPVGCTGVECAPPPRFQTEAAVDLSTATFTENRPRIWGYGKASLRPLFPASWKMACGGVQWVAPQGKFGDLAGCGELRPGFDVPQIRALFTEYLNTQFPTYKKYPIDTSALLRDANLSGADLTGSDLSGADLSGATTSMAAAAVRRGGRASNNGTRLVDSNMFQVRISGADLSKAELRGVRSGKVTGKPRKLPADWTLAKGYLVGPGANLSGAILSRADLRNADLTGANLTRAVLKQARLNPKKRFSIVGRPKSLPAGWALAGKILKKK